LLFSIRAIGFRNSLVPPGRQIADLRTERLLYRAVAARTGRVVSIDVDVKDLSAAAALGQ